MLFFTDGIFFFYANSKPKTILKRELAICINDNAGTDKNKKTTK